MICLYYYFFVRLNIDFIEMSRVDLHDLFQVAGKFGYSICRLSPTGLLIHDLLPPFESFSHRPPT